VQGFLKDVGIEAVLKIQKYGTYVATTGQDKFEGLVQGPSALPGNRLACGPQKQCHVACSSSLYA
jgi:hypothetical protein